MIHTEFQWGTDEGMTHNKVIERNGVSYLKTTVVDAHGNVQSVTETAADKLRASANQ